MDPSFEQASRFLDQALISYAGGQIEEASQHLANAAAVLHAMQLAPAGPKAEAEFPTPAVLPPVNAEPAPESSLAIAA